MCTLHEQGSGASLTIERCRDRIEALTEQRADIDDMIDELQRFVVILKDMVPPAGTASTGA